MLQKQLVFDCLDLIVEQGEVLLVLLVPLVGCLVSVEATDFDRLDLAVLELLKLLVGLLEVLDFLLEVGYVLLQSFLHFLVQVA